MSRSPRGEWCAVNVTPPGCRFLHLRAAADDFLDIVRHHAADFPRGGVVHSFDGTDDEARRVLELPQLAIGERSRSGPGTG